MGSALDYGVWLANEPHAARPLIGRPVRQRAGAQMLSWSHMRKQPNGTFGKNPGAIGQGAAGAGTPPPPGGQAGRPPQPAPPRPVPHPRLAFPPPSFVRIP